jgi:hypothetical protein
LEPDYQESVLPGLPPSNIDIKPNDKKSPK